ncbi:uncharacterized protein [Drosophila virilis]|uniref:uncharacterized protein n=1 Tax=Drosophila virilis TaxID=7244 RepID=UPI0038B37D01
MATKEESECEQHFANNFSRLPSGEYSVRLPLKRTLSEKLSWNSLLKEQYSPFIKKFLDLNHMSLVSQELSSCCKYFLPHHSVLKEDSTTTTFRIVFDDSETTDTGYCLNDVLMAGPIIQPKWFHILIRFRTYPVALTADICKMYRCVRVTSPDSYFQCIQWRDSPQKDIEIFKLDTVRYGTKSALFQSVCAMHQLLMSVLQTAGILSRGNFKLRKWCSSHQEVLNGVAYEDREQYLKFNDGSDITKARGAVSDILAQSEI